MDELLEHEGGQKLQFLLDSRDEAHEEKVVQLYEDQSQQQDPKPPEPVLPSAETEEVDELSQPAFRQQAGRSCETYGSTHRKCNSRFQIPDSKLNPGNKT